MVRYTAYAQNRTIKTVTCAAQVLVQFFANKLVTEKWLPIFRGEDDVNIDLGERLGHGSGLDGTPSGYVCLGGSLSQGSREARQPWAMRLNHFGVPRLTISLHDHTFRSMIASFCPSISTSIFAASLPNGLSQNFTVSVSSPM